MYHCTPEEAGISASHVRKFYEELESYNLSTHSVLLARGNAIFSECYYAPFDGDFLHRMYSVSKTFVSVAIGFCAQDGLLSLDEPFIKYLPRYTDGNENAARHTATIREMLSMESSRGGVNWFGKHPDDRAALYFDYPPHKYPGTLFDYDSSASFMLGVIVEELTGKPFLDYLQDKVLRDIGFSEEAFCIKAPGGHSFGDSGVMCTARDLLLFARFVMNGGTWNGKRYLNEEYLHAATTMHVINNDFGFGAFNDRGYGYKIWGMPRGCYAMLGMGNQVAFCDPAHDFLFVINSDNQGMGDNYTYIFTALYHNVLDHLTADGKSLPASPDAAALTAWLSDKKLFALPKTPIPAIAGEVNGKTFIPESNRMGIKWFRLELAEDSGVFHYENAQGVKAIPFGLGHNVLGQFPEEGYADLTVNTVAPGHTYRMAASADWPEEKKLRIRVQIIDKYFGNLAIVCGFRDARTVSVRMTKVAEDFLDEYSGVMMATAE